MNPRASRLIALTLLLILAAPGLAQQCWERTYGGSGWDCGYSVKQTTDGGYIVAGYTDSYGAGGYDVYLIKTNASGETLWTRTYGSAGDEWAAEIQLTLGGGYIIAGVTGGVVEGDFYLLKTRADGALTWSRTYGGPGTDKCMSVQQTADSGYVLAGYTNSYGAGGYDAYLIRTNASGDTLWTRTYGGAGDDAAMSVRQTADSGYILTGYTESYGAGNGDVYLIKTNAQGDTEWTRTCGQPGSFEEGCCVRQTTDRGYVVSGYTSGALDDAYIARFDSCGNTLWTRTYAGEGYDDAYAVQQTSDEGFIVVGGTETFNPRSPKTWLLKTDCNGDTTWTMKYGGSGSHVCSDIQLTSDGGYVFVGAGTPVIGGAFDVYLVKTDKYGSTAVKEESLPSARLQSGLSLSANRTLFTRSTLLTYALPGDPKSARLEIRDITGRLVRAVSPLTPTLSPKGRGSEGRFAWDGMDNIGRRLPSGCYFCALRAGTQTATAKILLTR